MYEFDYERFKKLYGKLCPCLVINKENATHDNMCPCTEFVKDGKCKCNLFKQVD